MKGSLKFSLLFKWCYRKYPKVYEMLCKRAERYNESVIRLEQLEKEGRVYIIRPEEALSIKRIENDPVKTAIIYTEAMALAQKEIPKLRKWLLE